MTLAIVAAMPPELAALQALMPRDAVQRVGGRDFHCGHLAGQAVVLCLSGIGKVAAASTTALLCHHFGAQALLFTGVAGGLAAEVKVGDVVLAKSRLQHDMDASPLFPRWEVPGHGRARFSTDAAWTERLARGVDRVLGHPSPALQAAWADLGLSAPRRHQGLVISGDRFVATQDDSAALRQALPDALAVEMEGAAVAQVCADFQRPLAVLRTISDRADEQAHLDFPRFLHQVAADLARDIVLATLRH